VTRRPFLNAKRADLQQRTRCLVNTAIIAFRNGCVPSEGSERWIVMMSVASCGCDDTSRLGVIYFFAGCR
jgi:hypothetical protein